MSLPRIHGEVGRLTGAPELRFTPAGKAVCSINIAFNKRRKNDQTGEWEDAGVVFVRGTAWEQLGENVAESLSKADEVIVSGELSVREFERSDGTKGSSLELRIYAIGPSLAFATAKVSKAERSGGQRRQQSPPADDPWASAPDDESPPF